MDRPACGVVESAGINVISLQCKKRHTALHSLRDILPKRYAVQKQAV